VTALVTALVAWSALSVRTPARTSSGRHRVGASVVAVDPTRTRTGLGIGALVTVALLTAGALTAAIAVGSSRPDPATASGATAHQETPTGGASGRTGTSDEGRPYAFWAIDHRGGPLRWDACTPIGFVLNVDRAPESAQRDVRAALAVLAAAAGLDLILDGVTEEEPSVDRPLVERDGNGWRWLPVLIAWAGPGEGGLPLTSLDRGIALPVAVRDGDREAFVTGQVILNVDRTDLVPGFDDRSTAVGATLLHELAHLLGLDHVTDPTQLMSVDPGSGPVRLGSGDRAGLERIGRAGGCNPAPAAESGRGLTHRGPQGRAG
jgi:hypothetical protein